ncbi:MAG TPA: hypothetical protein VGX70_01775 [Gemmataceae bacterium]|nr:hypothetical protein [Gemmataceae bacterium]
MEMVLLDWTRMGQAFCLAGAVAQDGGYRILRPLLANHRSAAARNIGWPAYLLNGRSRWEMFELIGAEPAEPQAPHREDCWVRSMRPRNRSVSPEVRRAILEATASKVEDSLFGAPLLPARIAAFLPPGTGQRSLTTVVLPSDEISFSFSQREGAPGPDIRVMLPVPPLGERLLIVKDHHLLAKTEEATNEPAGQIRFLNQALQQMGNQVAVRLGLSRAFQGDARSGAAMCWLMADGFFSFHDPQA